MQPSSLPLSDQELDKLDSFLLSSPDETLFLLSELDGFLASVVMCRDLVPREEWLEALFGEDMSCFENPEQRTEITDLVLRRHAEVLESLRAEPPNYNPIMDEDTDGSPLGEIWAEGFRHGMELRPDSWTPLWESKVGMRMLLPIVALSDPDLLAEVEPRKKKQSQRAAEYSADIYLCTEALYRFARMSPVELAEIDARFVENEARRAEPPSPKAGRNDPCPCGSGKKFKRCCGASG